MSPAYDAVLLVSFGGPEKREDVIPFLENVLRGKNVPRERMLEVAEHYYHFDGASPINAQNRELIAALEEELQSHGHRLPVYWGNRNWDPLLTDTVRQMKSAGIGRALAFVTSVFGSYSGCRQYLEDIAAARNAAGHDAPVIDKLRCPFNHPGFVVAMADRVQFALGQLPPDVRRHARLIYTAHSIPLAMAESSPYQKQLQEACRLVSEKAGHDDWTLVYQSRSGPPGQPWLEPDVCDYLQAIHAAGQVRAVVLAPIGFTSDHMEVLYDLDTDAQQRCVDWGLPMVRAGTPGTHPEFVRMIRQLIEERLTERPQRLAWGILEPAPDYCPDSCCRRIARPAAAG